MGEPQEIEDVEAEQVIGRVAAIDVAKASGMVCTRVPHDKRPGRCATKVWQVQATTKAIVELGDHLVCRGIERVVIESTSDYWRSFFYPLEARGLQVWLVNARDVKHLPGRPKSDKLALIAGERDPRVLAGPARGSMRNKNAALIQALTGAFDDHHAELAQMLLDRSTCSPARSNGSHCAWRNSSRRYPPRRPRLRPGR